MFVRDRMSSPAVTVREDESFQDVLKLMHERRFRRLPVVGRYGELVGIVSERDLLYASPSQATSLSIWEVHYLLAKLRVQEVMTSNVITTTPDTPIEDAAQLMVAHKIGGLPVLDEDDGLVGVITETDIFRTFVEMFAGGQHGVRLTLEVPEEKGVLLELCRTILDVGGNIMSVGSFAGVRAGKRGLVVKVQEVEGGRLVRAFDELGEHLLDAREG
jgi:acetoin utilization protein AcuB